MTLQPESSFSLPQETVRVARAAYPKGNLSMQMRDARGLIYQDQLSARGNMYLCATGSALMTQHTRPQNLARWATLPLYWKQCLRRSERSP